MENIKKIEELIKVIIIKTQDPEILPDFKAIRQQIKIPVIVTFEYERTLKNLIEQVHIKAKKYYKIFYEKSVELKQELIDIGPRLAAF